MALLGLVLLLLPLADPAAAQNLAQQFGGVPECRKACTAQQLNGAHPKEEGPVWVVLYCHFSDLFNRAPCATHPPGPGARERMAGFVTPCADTRNVPQGVHFGNCEFTLYSAMGPGVQFSGEAWRAFSLPGLVYDLELVGDTVFLYVTLRAEPGAPAVAVRARMETGASGNRGALLAESDPNDLSMRRHLVTLRPDDPYNAWEYEVPMRLRAKTLPGGPDGGGFRVTFTISQLDHPELLLGAPGWSLYTGAKFPPRLAFQVREPLRTESSRIHAFNGSLFLRWSVNSAWGSYDVHEPTLGLNSTGNSSFPMERLDRILFKRSFDHHGLQKPVNITWKIPYRDERLPDGDYRLTARISNFQRSLLLTQDYSFRIEGGWPQGGLFEGTARSPGPEVGMLLAGLLLLGWRRRGETERL